MDAVLEYAKVPVTIQAYTKVQSYTKATWTLSDPNDTRSTRYCAAVAATSSISEEVAGLKTNDDITFTLDGNFYPLNSFVLEEIYFGKLSKVFGYAHRENKNCTEKKNYRRNLKAVATNTDTKLAETDDPKTLFSDLTFTVADCP